MACDFAIILAKSRKAVIDDADRVERILLHTLRVRLNNMSAAASVCEPDKQSDRLLEEDRRPQTLQSR